AVRHISGHLNAPHDVVALAYKARDWLFTLRVLELSPESYHLGRQSSLRNSNGKLISDAQREVGIFFSKHLLGLCPQEHHRTEYLLVDDDRHDYRGARREDIREKRPGVLVLIRPQNLEHLSAANRLWDQFEYREFQRRPLQHFRRTHTGSSEIGEVNFAVCRIEHRQARGADLQQFYGAIEDSSGHLVEIRIGVYVVGYIQKHFVDVCFSLLLRIDMSVAIADCDLLRETSDEMDLVLVPDVMFPAMMQTDHAQEVKVEGYGHDQNRLAA